MTLTNAEAALIAARDQFQFYADEHTKVGKLEKAATNQAFADRMSIAISALEATGEPEAWDIVYRNRFTDNLTRDKEWAEKCAKRPDCTVTPLFTHPAPSVPAGWRLVPVEPTGAMCCAPFNHDDNRSSPAVRLTDDASNEAVAAFYRAMLAAAPEPDQ